MPHGALRIIVDTGLITNGSHFVVTAPERLDKIFTMIAFEKAFGGRSLGWINRLGLNYVHVATRQGTILLIPNETFVTQKIENLSYDDNQIRLNIPFSIAYESNLNKAKDLALSAAMSIDRILKIPQPKCLVIEYGDSSVHLQLRAWIDDPKNGIANVKDAVLMAVWDSFHANGIEIAFPQRDLHLKSAVPLKISKDSYQPVAKDSLNDAGDKGRETD